MNFPFKTTTKDGLKATVLGTMPGGRLAGFIEFGHGPAAWDWNADGSDPPHHGMSITLPLQIKPLTTYRMRNGKLAWTLRLSVGSSWMHGMIEAVGMTVWHAKDGRWSTEGEHPFDLIEELPPGTVV